MSAKYQLSQIHKAIRTRTLPQAMLTIQIKNGIMYGDENFFIPPNLNVGAFVLHKILEHKNKIALINGETGDEITYREIAQKVVNIASSLTDIGVTTGDVVAILSENRMEYFITTIAVYCCGGIITFFNNAYTSNELVHTINISKPKYMFLSGEAYESHYNTLKSNSDIKKYILYDYEPKFSDCLKYRDLSERYLNIEAYKPVPMEGKPRTCMILYSSGTTGLAKGAKLTNLNLIVAYQQPLMTQRPVVPLMIAPWSSTMGQICCLQEIVFGRTFVFLPKYKERLYIRTIEKYKIGMLSVAPPTMVMLCKSTIVNEYDISCVELIYAGGAAINPKVITQLKTRFPHIKHVLQGYGMTEASGGVCVDLESAPKEGSVGRIVPGIIIKVADPETNKVLIVGEPGEIRIKGPLVFDGYVGRDIKNDCDDEGYYRTGDIGYYDEEGYFYIVDRIKELIKFKAWQVSPSELEAILLQHPAIQDAGVTGTPDLMAGELPTAFVVVKSSAQVSKQDVINYVSGKVAPWKRLRGGVIFVDEIPKTASGKILRRKLQALLPKQNSQKLASKL